MNIKSIYLATVCSIVGSVSAQAVLTINISPVVGDDFSYILSASGTGGTTSTSTATGTLFLSGFAFGNGTDNPPAGLTFGGVTVTSSTPTFFDSFEFAVASPLASGSAYSFAGGPVTIAAPGGFLATFAPGTYSITGSNGIFGNDATGTLTIGAASPIPEPSTYIALAGFAGLGLFLVRRRMKAKTASADA